MKNKLTFPVAIAVLVVATIAITRSPLAANEPGGGIEHPAESVSEAMLHQLYRQRLAANSAAVQAWKANHPGNVTNEPSSEELARLNNYGCPQGTLSWQRDSITPLCAATCASDNDCGPPNARCRILDFHNDETMMHTILVDDLSPEERETFLHGQNPQSPPVLACDPFWDIEGPTDLDDVGAVENEVVHGG